MVQLKIFHPTPNNLVKADQRIDILGEASDQGMPEPILIQSVTVALDDQPLINAALKVISDPHLTRRSFEALVRVPHVPGRHTIVVTAINDRGISTTQKVNVWVPWWDGTVPMLQKVTISFKTHNDNKDSDTIIHVFVKNRSNTSSTPEHETDYISNRIAFEEHEEFYWGKNPYLAFAENLAPGMEFEDPSTHQFDIPLRSAPIPLDEIVLPVVNIHILTNGNDRWIFSYTITFLFDDGSSFQASSDTDGVTGIILDQDNRNYSGICIENPFKSLPQLQKPLMTAMLTKVTLKFYTHDDNKDNDTKLNVHIVNRLSASSSKDIAVGLDILKGLEFKDQSTNTIEFPSPGLPLASNSIFLSDIVLPVVSINIGPNGNDRWIFDYEVTFEFSDGRKFSSRKGGVILDQDNHKHTYVYQGTPFPSVIPPGRPQVNLPDQPLKKKVISLSYLKSKLEEFINKRQGTASEDPPIVKIRLDNAGKFGNTEPESYYDLQTIEASTLSPGTVPPSDFKEFTYSSSTQSLGQLGLNKYFKNLESNKLTVTLDSTNPNPLTVDVIFDTSQPGSGVGDWQVSSLSLRISLSIAFDPINSVIDVLSWIPSIINSLDHPDPNDPNANNLSLLIAQFLSVHIVTSNTTDAGGFFQQIARKNIFDTLKKPDPFDGKTLRDKINIHFTSWLLGGLVGGASGIKVKDVAINGDNLEITYTGPASTFAPQIPAGWPSGIDFSRGNLANIEHIVVLTMENRSFDTMLGYLSLPLDKGGMGRKDIDGLKGSEVNMLNGKACPTFAFAAHDTIFAPPPPHGYEPVHNAINGGKMNGFVQAYADERGTFAAPRVMGHHTAVNVPVYDALARDFAICHRWFASHPGPTFCNRFYELTGMLNIDAETGFWEFDNSSRLRPVFTPTIFDYLTDLKVSWKCYEHHYCFLRFFQRYTFDPSNIIAFDDPIFGFENLARAGSLPNVTFIEPHYIELPPHANDDDPPADINAGQNLVERVVKAVVSSPKWNKTLLIITYDEHGGFYDHVPPPLATKVSPESLSTYGVRVPAFVISPWVKGGTVFGNDGIVGGGPGGGANPNESAANINPTFRALHFDHTSILKTIAKTFMNTKPPYLGPRYAAANDLSSVIGNELRPGPFRPFIEYNFVYGASQKRLEVQDDGVTPGTALLQSDPKDTFAQQFSFESAGNGFWYIRTHTGRLYITADDSLRIKLDIKYPIDGSSTAANNPDRQRWKFTSGISILDRNNFAIWNAAFPGKVLQPSDGSNNSGVGIILGSPHIIVAVHPPNPWQVTSPQLHDDPVNHP